MSKSRPFSYKYSQVHEAAQIVKILNVAFFASNSSLLSESCNLKLCLEPRMNFITVDSDLLEKVAERDE